jgi:hypothetical protein
MTVYVYKLAGQRGKPFTYNYPFPWYGLTADTADELHPFAESMGMYRSFYRPYRPYRSNGAEVPMAGTTTSIRVSVTAPPSAGPGRFRRARRRSGSGKWRRAEAAGGSDAAGRRRRPGAGGPGARPG